MSKKIHGLSAKVDEVTRNDENSKNVKSWLFLFEVQILGSYYKTEEEKCRIDKLIEEYQAAIQNKDFLIDKLDNTERELWVFFSFLNIVSG